MLNATTSCQHETKYDRHYWAETLSTNTETEIRLVIAFIKRLLSPSHAVNVLNLLYYALNNGTEFTRKEGGHYPRFDMSVLTVTVLTSHNDVALDKSDITSTAKPTLMDVKRCHLYNDFCIATHWRSFVNVLGRRTQRSSVAILEMTDFVNFKQTI